MKQLEKRQRPQRGSLERGALRSRELGPEKGDAACLFMRADAKWCVCEEERQRGQDGEAGS